MHNFKDFGIVYKFIAYISFGTMRLFSFLFMGHVLANMLKLPDYITVPICIIAIIFQHIFDSEVISEGIMKKNREYYETGFFPCPVCHRDSKCKKVQRKTVKS